MKSKKYFFQLLHDRVLQPPPVLRAGDSYHPVYSCARAINFRVDWPLSTLTETATYFLTANKLNLAYMCCWSSKKRKLKAISAKIFFFNSQKSSIPVSLEKSTLVTISKREWGLSFQSGHRLSRWPCCSRLIKGPHQHRQMFIHIPCLVPSRHLNLDFMLALLIPLTYDLVSYRIPSNKQKLPRFTQSLMLVSQAILLLYDEFLELHWRSLPLVLQCNIVKSDAFSSITAGHPLDNGFAKKVFPFSFNTVWN